MNIVLTGKPGCGKTTVCEKLMSLFRGKGLRCGGILCLEMKSEGRRLGKIAVNVATGEKKMIAAIGANSKWGGSGRYVISSLGIEFGKKVIRDAGDCDVVFVDEIGPLELSGGGLMEAAKEAIESKENIIVIVRSKLLEMFVERFEEQGFTVFDVTEKNRDDLPKMIMGYIQECQLR